MENVKNKILLALLILGFNACATAQIPTPTKPVLCLPVTEMISRLEIISERYVSAAGVADILATYYPGTDFQQRMYERSVVFRQAAAILLVEIQELEKLLPPVVPAPVKQIDSVTR